MALEFMREPRAQATTTTLQEQFGGTLVIKSQPAGTSTSLETDSQPAPGLTIDLLPAVADPIIPGSLLLLWGGTIYVDRDGVLYADISSQTNAGTAAGTVDYAGRTCTLSGYPANQTGSISVLACLTGSGGFGVTGVTGRTPGAPIRVGSLQVTAVRADTGAVEVAVADANGNFSGPVIWGSVDVQTGIYRLTFSTDPNDTSGLSNVPVIPGLLRYNAVLYSSLPLSAEQIGLDPVRLPADGRVPIYREGDVVVIHHTASTEVASPQAGGTEQLDRDHQAEISVVAADGTALDPAQYIADRAAGTVTWANPLIVQDADGNLLALPLAIRDRVEHMTMVTEVQITGALAISSPIPWDLPADETLVSSALVWGDMQARIFNWFTQKTWSSGDPNWSDSPEGDSTTAQYDDLHYPPIITNHGGISGKWALVFTSQTVFNVVEEQLGIVASGTISSDCSPTNPATQTPYFTIRADGWGSGWAAGNAIRFNTDACLGPMWCVRTIQPGQGTVDDDSFRLQVRGDAD